MKTYTESELKKLIQGAFPDATVKIDDITSKGLWIDIENHGIRATVEYRIEQGFGISAAGEEVAFGEGPDEISESAEELIKQLGEILGSNGKPA